MSDTFYPSVDIGFIELHIVESGKLVPDGVVKIGSTTTYICAGNTAIYRRSVFIRELQAGQICLEQATALALRFSFMGALLEWLEINRNWKEGAYIQKEDTTVVEQKEARG